MTTRDNLSELAFEVETKGQKQKKPENAEHNPVNVKVKVKNQKQDAHKSLIIQSTNKQHETLDVIKLDNSDQTIMSFDVYMEDERNLKQTKSVLGKSSPGGYFDSENPNSQKQSAVWFLGSKCKPGGCLDPKSTDEDKYAYVAKQETPLTSKTNENSIKNSTDKVRHSRSSSLNSFILKTKNRSKNSLCDKNETKDDRSGNVGDSASRTVIAYSSKPKQKDIDDSECCRKSLEHKEYRYSSDLHYKPKRVSDSQQTREPQKNLSPKTSSNPSDHDKNKTIPLIVPVLLPITETAKNKHAIDTKPQNLKYPSNDEIAKGEEQNNINLNEIKSKSQSESKLSIKISKSSKLSKDIDTISRNQNNGSPTNSSLMNKNKIFAAETHNTLNPVTKQKILTNSNIPDSSTVPDNRSKSSRTSKEATDIVNKKNSSKTNSSGQDSLQIHNQKNADRNTNSLSLPTAIQISNQRSDKDNISEKNNSLKQDSKQISNQNSVDSYTKSSNLKSAQNNETLPDKPITSKKSQGSNNMLTKHSESSVKVINAKADSNTTISKKNISSSQFHPHENIAHSFSSDKIKKTKQKTESSPTLVSFSLSRQNSTELRSQLSSDSIKSREIIKQNSESHTESKKTISPNTSKSDYFTNSSLYGKNVDSAKVLRDEEFIKSDSKFSKNLSDKGEADTNKKSKLTVIENKSDDLSRETNNGSKKNISFCNDDDDDDDKPDLIVKDNLFSTKPIVDPKLHLNFGFESRRIADSTIFYNTFDPTHKSTSANQQTNVVIVQTLIQNLNGVIKLPIDAENELNISFSKINKNEENLSMNDSQNVKAKVNQEGAENGTKQITKTSNQIQLERPNKKQANIKNHDDLTNSRIRKNLWADYVKEIFTLQDIIKDVKVEIDKLAVQQTLLREKIINSGLTKNTRTHTHIALKQRHAKCCSILTCAKNRSGENNKPTIHKNF